MQQRSKWIFAAGLALLVALGLTQAALESVVAEQNRNAREAPRFEVDPFWPKPLPNHWVLGNAIGVWVDDQDRVWIVHRGSATLADNEKALELKAGDCCAGAPPVLAFDRQGNLVKHWGGPGPGYDWPASNHGIFVDPAGNVWIGGNGPADSHIVKFTQDGKFLAQYGKPGARRGAPDAKGQPTFAGSSHDKASYDGNVGRETSAEVRQSRSRASNGAARGHGLAAAGTVRPTAILSFARDDSSPEPDHHFLPGLVAPPHLLGRIGIEPVAP